MRIRSSLFSEAPWGLFRQKCVLTACCLLLPLLFGTPVATAITELQVIRQSASKSPQLISSIQFEMVGKKTIQEGPNEKKILESFLTCYMQRGSFRCEYKLTNPAIEEKLLHWTTAFDGDRYQTLMHDSQILALSDASQLPHPQLELDCLSTPYLWLFDGQLPSSWSIVRDSRSWERAFDNASFKGIEKGQHELYVVSFPGAYLPNANWEVGFAKDMDYFPLRVEAFIEGNKVGTIQSAEVEATDVDGERAYIATKIIHTQSSKSSSISSEYAIVPGSLIINPRIDEELFTISTSKALVVNDLDQIKDYAQPSMNPLIAKPHDLIQLNSENHNRSIPIFINIGIVLLLLILLVAKLVRNRRLAVETER